MSTVSRTVSGFTLVEVLAVVAVTTVLLSVTVHWGALDRVGLTRSARIAEAQLTRARLHALASRRPTRVTVSGGHLDLAEQGGQRIARIDLRGSGLGRLDSIRLRPATLRFNTRGHGSPGSLYLYRGLRGVRIVCNFVGRLRVVPFRI